MSILARTTPPRYLSNSHESKTESIQKALADAYDKLGLPINAAVKDESLVDLYRARAGHDPFQKEALLESIRTIAQHKDRSDILQDFLKSFSISACETGLVTLGAGLLTDDSSLILLYKSSAAQSPSHQDRAQKALKLIADHRGNEQLKSFVSTGFKGELQQFNTHSNESTKTSADEKYDIILNEIRYVKVVCEAAKKSSLTPSKSFEGHQESTTEENGADYTCPASGVQLGTIDKPTPAYGHYTATLIRVIAGDKPYGYFEYYVNKLLLEQLLRHPDCSQLRHTITTFEPTVIEEVNPYYFSSLLDLLHFEGRYPEYVAPRGTPFNQYVLPNLYVLAIKFRLTGISDELKHVFGKAPCFGQFLSAAEQVYQMGGADDVFRSFFKDQVKQWLDDPKSARADQCCDNSWGMCGRSYTEEFLRSAVNIPDLGRDTLDVFVDREVARGITHVTHEEEVGEARRECAEAGSWGDGGAGIDTQDGAESDTDSYHREREAQPEVSKEWGPNSHAVTDGWPPEEDVDGLADGKTLFIGNVSSWDAVNQLWNCFALYGEVVDMYRLDDHNGEDQTAAARVKFATKDDAEAVMNAHIARGFVVDHRELYITYAHIDDVADYLAIPYLLVPQHRGDHRHQC